MAEKRKLTAGEWFGRADQFWSASEVMHESGHSLALPGVVCMAFAAEAYLKGLLTVRGRSFRTTHDLRWLFRRLPAEDKKAIEEKWNEVVLPTVLNLGKNAPSGVKPLPTHSSKR